LSLKPTQAPTAKGYRAEGPLSQEQALALLAASGPGAEAKDFFCTPEWFDTLARHGMEGGHQAAWFVVFKEGSSACFALPLLAKAKGTAAVYGRGLAGLSNFYSSLYGPLGQLEACTLDGCRALVAHLKRQGSVLDLQPLDVDHPFFKHLLLALRLEGWLCDSYFCFGNWYLEVGGRDFTAYEPTIPSRIRNTVKRGLKKLKDTSRWQLEVVQEPGPALEQALQDWATIYAKSWKVPEPFPSFVPALCHMAAQQGWLRLGVVRVDSVPIAAQIWLLHQGRMLIYKLAYDEQHKQFSAGSVLTTELMRRALDVDRCAEVDYLTGDDAYKADWMSHRRERRGIVAFNPLSLQGLLSAGRHFAGKAWSQYKARKAIAKPGQSDQVHERAVV